MAISAWPATLQQSPLRQGFSVQAVDNIARAPVDIGPAKLRRRSRTARMNVQAAIYATSEQRDTFATFVQDALAGGAERFIWAGLTDEVPGDYSELQFAAKPTYTPMGCGWMISMELAALPAAPPIILVRPESAIMSANVSSLLIYTRASTETYYDSAGVLQTAGPNELMMDYNFADLTYRGLKLVDSGTLVSTGVDFVSGDAGTFTIVCEPAVIANERVFTIDDGTANNKIDLSIDANGKYIFTVISGGVTAAQLDTGVVAEYRKRKEFMCAWNANDFRAIGSGGILVSDASGNVPTGLTEVDVGINQWIYLFRYRPDAVATLTAAAEVDVPFTEAQLFANGEQGGVYVVDDTSKLWQDAAKTVQADGASEPVRAIEPTFGSGDATAPTDAARPLLQLSANRIVFDLVDDDIQVPITTDGWLMVATTQGTYWGQYKWSAGQGVGAPNYNPTFDVVGIAGTDDVPTGAEEQGMLSYFRTKGALEFGDVGAATNLSELIREAGFITLDVSAWDTSSVTSFLFFALNCTSLTTLDVSAWNTSSVTSFRYFVYNCSALTTLDVSAWDTSSVTDFTYFALGCSALTTLDVSAWDASSVTSFLGFIQSSHVETLDISGWDMSNVTSFTNFALSSGLKTITVGNAFAASPCTAYSNAFNGCSLDQTSVDAVLVSINNAGTSNGSLHVGAGTNATPSATGQAAADALRARGWTVVLNGY